MRVFVPTWAILTALYLVWGDFKKAVVPFFTFSLSLFPFFAIIPVLEYFYSGAVLNHERFVFESVYKLIYPYLSSFDLSFLFIKGDEFLIHSTGSHGMLLLMSLPLFIAGLTMWKKSRFWKLIVLSFFLGPILFGVVGSIHRASRMLAEIPIYVLISSAGFLWLWEKKSKIVIGVFVFLFALNYFDFIHYYWGRYASDTKDLFYDYTYWEGGYKTLYEKSSKNNLTPYIDIKYSGRGDTTADFMRTIYFVKPIAVWDGNAKDLPMGSILMTDNEKLTSLKKVSSYKNFIFYTRQ